MKQPSTLNLAPHSSHMHILKRIERNSKVLDVGCGPGKLGKILIKEKNCEVWGIEINKQFVKNALKNGYKKVVVGDVEKGLKFPFRRSYFDYIIFADILEHLKEPERILIKLKPFLKKGGYVICSIPNIANFVARIRLLFGVWEYEYTGIFDRTHLRFFNLKTAKELLEKVGFKIEEVDYTPINLSPATFLNMFKIQKEAPKTKQKIKDGRILRFLILRKLRYKFMKIRPTLFALQFVIKGKCD
jgi:methionine biosynthesis protein MetW